MNLARYIAFYLSRYIPLNIKPLPMLLATLLIGCASSPKNQRATLPSSFPEIGHPLRNPRQTQEFRPTNGTQKKHWGLDFGGSMDTSVFAAHDGRVIYQGNGFSGFGNLVIIETDDKEWASFYAHLNYFKVKDGQRVRRGSLIGTMGRTGRATGVHLHFELRYKKNPIDPSIVLNQNMKELL